MTKANTEAGVLLDLDSLPYQLAEKYTRQAGVGQGLVCDEMARILRLELPAHLERTYLAAVASVNIRAVRAEGRELFEAPRNPKGFRVAMCTPGEDAYLIEQGEPDRTFLFDSRARTCLEIKNPALLVGHGSWRPFDGDAAMVIVRACGYGLPIPLG